MADSHDQSDALKRYLEMGLALTQMTRDWAEDLVRNLVSKGHIPGEHTEAKVQDVLHRSHQASDALIDLLRREVPSQLSNLSPSRVEELVKLAGRITESVFPGQTPPSGAEEATGKGATAPQVSSDERAADPSQAQVAKKKGDKAKPSKKKSTAKASSGKAKGGKTASKKAGS